MGLGDVTVSLHLHYQDAADIEAGLKKAASIHARCAEAMKKVHAGEYHKRLAARYSELADLVKRRTDPVVHPENVEDVPGANWKAPPEEEDGDDKKSAT